MSNTITKTALYIRVSTVKKTRHTNTISFDQDPAVQEQPLRDLIKQRGWTLYRIYSDRASGSKGKPAGTRCAHGRRASRRV